MPKITFEKIISTPRSTVFQTFVDDYPLLQKYLPQYFPSIRIRSSRGNTTVMEEHNQILGKEMVMTTKHISNTPTIHEIFVIGGDLKGSHIIQKYQTVSQGTKIIIIADIKLGRNIMTRKLTDLTKKNRLENDLIQIINAQAKLVS